MRTIKEVGLLNLLKDGDLLACDSDTCAHKCLTSDLKTQEVIENLEIITNYSNQFLKCMEQTTPLVGEKDEVDKKLQNIQKQIKTKKEAFPLFAGMCLAIAIAGGFVSLVSVAAGYESGNIGLGISVLLTIWSINSISNPNSREIKILRKQETEIEQQKENLTTQEEKICTPLYVKNRYQALIIMQRLLMISDNLKKIAVILSDSTIRPSDMIIKIESFLTLQQQKLIQEQMLAKSQQATEYMQKQADRMTSELQKQTHILREKVRLDEERRQDGQSWRF